MLQGRKHCPDLTSDRLLKTMGKEIERKFLAKNANWKTVPGTLFRQGYLSTEPSRTVRVRIEGNRAVITIKGLTEGVTRLEFEYEIPTADAEELLNSLCEHPLIEKHRYKLKHDGLTWEVDEFHGSNEGLVIVEVELESEDQSFDRPEWLGKEVSDDPRYYNASLVKNPFSNWSEIP